MDSLFFIAYLILAASAICQSLLLALQTWEHRRYVRSSMGSLSGRKPSGHIAVFAPCKGFDIDLAANLRAVLRQDYDDYDVTFVVESEDDPACETIRSVMAEHPRAPSRLVVAGRATITGQKVHNLRTATADLPPNVKFLAFVDSDAAPRPEWLRTIGAALEQKGRGAVTGYRWFVPTRNSIVNGLLYSLNCDVMVLLGHSSYYLIWGGSWGIRREVFDSIGLNKAWEGMLSDDLVAARELRRAKLPVRFEPGCVLASPMDYPPGQMFEFLRRQYLVGRFYAPGWWLFALGAATFSNLAWLVNFAALGAGLVWGTPPVWIPLCLGTVFYLLRVFRGFIRQDVVREYFPEQQQALRVAGWFDIWAGPLVGLVNWLGVAGSVVGSCVSWRAIRYRLSTGGVVVEVERREDAIPETEPDSYVLKMPVQEPVRYRKAG